MSSTGAESDGPSYEAAISADGHFVVFVSNATNLVAGVTRHTNVFLRNRATGTTSLISVRHNGKPGAGSQPSISGSGRYVAFESYARLVPKDTNGTDDVYLRDRSKHTTTLISVSTRGTPGDDPTPGSDPRSIDPAMSADGRYVTFSSWAPNLVRHDTNGAPDVFVRDRLTGVTSRVSVSSTEGQANGRSLNSSISAHGRYVAFASEARELEPGSPDSVVDVFVRDRRTGTTRLVSVPSAAAPTVGEDGDSYYPSISGDGRYVAFVGLAPDPVQGDPEIRDVFVRDRVARTTEQVSVSLDGTTTLSDNNADPVISADGRYVAFDSHAADLVAGEHQPRGGRVRPRPADPHDASRVDEHRRRGGRRPSSLPVISAHGAHIAFISAASNLVPLDVNLETDCFMRDLPR